MAEVKENKIEVKVEQKVVGYLKKLNDKETKKVTLRYNAAMREALDSGSPTTEDIMNHLRSRNLWTEEKQEEYQKVQKQCETIENDLLNRSMEKKERIELALKLKVCRSSQNSFFVSSANLLNHTAESYAGMIRNQFVTFLALVDEKGEQIWDDFEKFCESEDPRDCEAVRQVALRSFGIDPSNVSIEDQVLRSCERMTEEGFILNEDGKMINMYGILIDKLSRPVDKDGYLIDASKRFINENGTVVKEEEKVKGSF